MANNQGNPASSSLKKCQITSQLVQFIEGKDGGTYQIHMPGLSFLLYPFYYLDRHYLSPHARLHPEFPTRLTATSTAVLGMYTLWGLLIFRLVKGYVGRPGHSWVLAITAVMTIPVAPFNFQFYPEVPAGIIIILLCHSILSVSRGSVGLAVLLGLLGGFLPWLHVRLLLVSLVLVVGLAARSRENRSAAAAVLAGYTSVLASLGLYFYHITGSPLPTSMYAAIGGTVLDLGGMPPGLFGFMFDRVFGILPHAPVYALAFLGLAPLIRERRKEAMFICLAAAAVVGPAAAHTPWAGGASTPARLVVSVVPLLVIPIAYAMKRFKTSRLFWVVAGLLWVVSLRNAFVFNSYLARGDLRLSDSSVSGWSTTLMFPSIMGISTAEMLTSPSVLIWIGCAIAGLVAPYVVAGFARGRSRPADGVSAYTAPLGNCSRRSNHRRWAAQPIEPWLRPSIAASDSRSEGVGDCPFL